MPAPLKIISPRSVNNFVAKVIIPSSIEDQVILRDSVADISDDPALWIINNKTIDEIIRRGFQQNKNADFTKSKKIICGRNRSMQKSLFIRTLKNGRTQNRDWLIYSKSTYSIFCGPCKLFNKGNSMSKGYSDWSNAYQKLADHERSFEHNNSCLDLKNRYKSIHTNLGVDKKINQHDIDEFNYWRRVMHYAVAAIKKLTSRGLSLRGDNQIF